MRQLHLVDLYNVYIFFCLLYSETFLLLLQCSCDVLVAGFWHEFIRTLRVNTKWVSDAGHLVSQNY